MSNVEKEEGRIKVMDPRRKALTTNALIRTILDAWKEHK
jgi:hypothetical protein